MTLTNADLVWLGASGRICCNISIQVKNPSRKWMGKPCRQKCRQTCSSNKQSPSIHAFYCIEQVWWMRRYVWNGVNGFINSLAPVRCDGNLKSLGFKLIVQHINLGTICTIALIQMLQNLTHEISILVQVMTWCRQAANHHPSQCCPNLCRLMASLGHNELN